jgi:hypothetical protein
MTNGTRIFADLADEPRFYEINPRRSVESAKIRAPFLLAPGEAYPLAMAHGACPLHCRLLCHVCQSLPCLPVVFGSHGRFQFLPTFCVSAKMAVSAVLAKVFLANLGAFRAPSRRCAHLGRFRRMQLPTASELELSQFSKNGAIDGYGHEKKAERRPTVFISTLSNWVAVFKSILWKIE